MACCCSIRSRLATASAVMTKQKQSGRHPVPNELLVHLYPLDIASILAAGCFKMPLEIHGVWSKYSNAHRVSSLHLSNGKPHEYFDLTGTAFRTAWDYDAPEPVSTWTVSQVKLCPRASSSMDFVLSRRQIRPARGTKLDSVRQMDLGTNLRDCRRRRVPDRAGEHLTRAVVVDNQLDPATGLPGRVRRRVPCAGFA